MIITVSSLKGGVGKSTISQNLAVCFAHQGYSVAIVDADVNQSTIAWSEDRDEGLPYVHVSGLPDGKALSKNIVGLNENYDIVLVDGTPSLNPTTSRIIMIADILLIPVKAGVMDLRATQKFIDRYEQAVELKGEEIPVYFLFNQYTGYNISRNTMEILDQSDIKTLNSKLGNRVAYGEATGNGMGVYEYKKDRIARGEIVALAKEVQGILENM